MAGSQREGRPPQPRISGQAAATLPIKRATRTDTSPLQAALGAPEQQRGWRCHGWVRARAPLTPSHSTNPRTIPERAPPAFSFSFHFCFKGNVHLKTQHKVVVSEASARRPGSMGWSKGRTHQSRECQAGAGAARLLLADTPPRACPVLAEGSCPVEES